MAVNRVGRNKLLLLYRKMKLNTISFYLVRWTLHNKRLDLLVRYVCYD